MDAAKAQKRTKAIVEKLFRVGRHRKLPMLEDGRACRFTSAKTTFEYSI